MSSKQEKRHPVDEWRIHGITVRLWLLPLLVVAALVGGVMYLLYGLHLVFVIFTAPPLVALTLCVAITEGVMWMVDEWRIHGITVRLWLLPLLVVAALVGGVMYLL